MEPKLIDHLFRHHSGKMVSVLTRVFGLSNLEIIEDAIQDTFIKASISWRKEIPENPEGWLTKAAKNRVLDIFRKLKTEKNHIPNFKQGTNTIALHEVFLESEIEDAQLRMIFTACHPKLDAKDRIAFALKTVSGFSRKEIASALLTKEETIKKRLTRARKVIKKENIVFKIPQGKALKKRIESVLEVLYLIFNEGFHSNKKKQLIQEELCGEAMRLSKMLLKNVHTRTSESYALFALMCFHAARLGSKTNAQNEILDLEHQDRNLWHFPLIELGNAMMYKAVKNNEFSCYHYEAAIAAEHLKVAHFKDTNWDKILYWYTLLNNLKPMANNILTMAIICVLKNDLYQAEAFFKQIHPNDFEQRKYLFYGAKSDYFVAINNKKEALKHNNLALENVNNQLEKEYLLKRKKLIVLI